MTMVDNHFSSASATGTVRRVSWGAIFAGTVLAVALMIFFATLGIGIGTAILDPQFDRNPGEGLPTSAGIYLVVTQLVALAAGGFVAARLAGIPRTMASILHGASVWAVATTFLAWASVTGAGAVFGAAGSLMSGTAGAVASAGEAIIPDDISLPDPSALAEQITIDDLPDELQATLRENGITEENLRAEAKAAFRKVFSKAEQAETTELAKSTLQDIIKSPGDIGADLDAFVDQLVGGENAIISSEDREQAIATLERRLGVTPQEAEEVVNTVEASVKDAISQVRETAQAAQTKAIEAAQTATDAIASIALLLSLASILGLAAACGGAFAAKPETLVGDRVDDHV